MEVIYSLVIDICRKSMVRTTWFTASMQV